MSENTVSSESQRVTRAEMATELRARRALPLLRTSGIPDPVQYRQQWWAVPLGGDDYRPVADPAQIDLLNTAVTRITGLRAASTSTPRVAGGERR